MRQTRGKRLNRYVEDYVIFDLETTGVRPTADEIIEISAIRVKNHLAAEEYTTLVNPQIHIPASATAINHITDEMVKNAPLLEEAMKSFLAFIGDHILVGHNIHSFDMNFIQAASLRFFESEIKNDYIDTLYMARQCLPQLPHHRLTDLAEYFHISTQGAHRALNDCRMNQRCYEALGKLLGEQPDVSCPKCGASMVRRKGKFGEFYGCSDFPRCRGTRKL
ncbi:MAG: DNA polymerase III subunit epsilon [Lachnospiraceae bacterium]|nr:DNA polymerase III subunit epsilon [Lachnospiraceae bacterium]MCI9148939.1 DNA polymerase III subunit epsilon [Lachnospiraceae bacterium]